MALTPELLRAIKGTLLSGGYSLLLGAGVSRDSRNGVGPLPSGDELRNTLIGLKKLKPSSNLARAYQALTQGDIDTHITDRFIKCSAGPSLLQIPNFNWRRIYTLNVDDALEAAYQTKPGHQSPVPLTHLSPYMDATDVDVIQIVHVHGWVGCAEDGYVFSLPEYANVMGPGNPWTSTLAHTIASEPFIIAGTSLDEPDLEYFLAGRRSEGARKDRGPSFLIEPSPDAATQKECDRHGLILYQGSFQEFLEELDEGIPSRPLPANASSELSAALFNTAPSKRELTIFSRDFLYVVAQQGRDDADYSFYVGRHPTRNDIALGRDVSRESTLALKARIRDLIGAADLAANFLVVDDNAGAGKTTIGARTMFDLAGEGFHVFEYRSLSTPNLDICARVLNEFGHRAILFCDNFADHVAAFVELQQRIDANKFLIVGVERSYRVNHIKQTLAGARFVQFTPKQFTEAEARDLVIAMDKYGLTSAKDLARHAADLAKDPIAIAVCRAMSDFRPVEDIINSLLKDADGDRIERYSACALAAYCYKVGLAHSVLSAAFDVEDLARQLTPRDMLPLTFSDIDSRDYVIPMNPTLGLRVLRQVAVVAPNTLYDVYCRIGANIAPYVNRLTIRRRTPEARLAQRLFNYDDVVSEFIPNKSEQFYLAMKRFWEWNSRYWEQFALLKLDKFRNATGQNRLDLLAQSISHARHAI